MLEYCTPESVRGARGNPRPYLDNTESRKSEMRLTEELRERTKHFASVTIRFYIKLPLTREEVKVLGKQLLRSGTSVAAHAREASRARSDSKLFKIGRTSSGSG